MNDLNPLSVFFPFDSHTLGEVLDLLVSCKILEESQSYIALGLCRLQRSYQNSKSLKKKQSTYQQKLISSQSAVIGAPLAVDISEDLLPSGQDQLSYGDDHYSTLKQLEAFEAEALLGLIGALAHRSYQLGHTVLPMQVDDLLQIFLEEQPLHHVSSEIRKGFLAVHLKSQTDSSELSFTMSEEDQEELIKNQFEELLSNLFTQLVNASKALPELCGGILKAAESLDSTARAPLVLHMEGATKGISIDRAWTAEFEVKKVLSSLTTQVSLPKLAGEQSAPADLYDLLKKRMALSPLQANSESYFPYSPQGPQHLIEAVQRHRLAALSVLSNRVSFIHGGPGTGKTTLAQKILALLLECDEVLRQESSEELPKLRVAIAAPTGKAAVRVRDSILQGIVNETDQVLYHLAKSTKQALIDLELEGITLHRLLKYHPDNPSYTKYSSEQPLPYDVLIVDEASMLDLPLIKILLQAIPQSHTQNNQHPIQRLIFLGDPDQLPPVGTGSFWRDQCREIKNGKSIVSIQSRTWTANEDFTQIINQICPQLVLPSQHYNILSEYSAELAGSFRVSANSKANDILNLASLVREGNHTEALSLLTNSKLNEDTDNKYGVYWIETEHYRSQNEAKKFFEKNKAYQGFKSEIALKQYITWLDKRTNSASSLKKHIASLKSNSESLDQGYKKAQEQFKKELILCAHYEGPLGVDFFNDKLKKRSKNNPILVLNNHAHQQLYNGDIGFLSSEAEGMALFDGLNSEGIRQFPIHNIPKHDVVYAMSIHKSQGSDFDSVIITLPPHPSRLLGRELLYTAITRAKKRVIIISSRESLIEAITKQVSRYTLHSINV